MTPFGRSSSTAFTLVELLVVISVLAILASMLLPAIGLVESSAKPSNCLSNQRQIHLALASYTNDNEGNLPAGWVSSRAFVSWDDLLSDFDGRNLPMSGNGSLNRKTEYLSISGTPATTMKLFTLYTCPADENAKKGPVISGTLSPGFWTRTYVFPGNFTSGDGTGDPAVNPGLYSTGGGSGFSDWAANLHSIAKPSQKILLAEMLNIYSTLGRSNYATCKGPGYQALNNAQSVAYGSLPQPLHRTTWNYLFCDGHVEALAGSQTRNPGNNASDFPGLMWKRMQ